jgi:predicted transcriptional regulator
MNGSIWRNPMATLEATPKELMIQAIQELPDDSSYEEILRELAFARMIERGLADSTAGRTISHEEMGRRIAAWAR